MLAEHELVHTYGNTSCSKNIIDFKPAQTAVSYLLITGEIFFAVWCLQPSACEGENVPGGLTEEGAYAKQAK